jgi:hypothetical protein
MNAYRILVRKAEGERPLARPKCRCEDNMSGDWMSSRADLDIGAEKISLSLPRVEPRTLRYSDVTYIDINRCAVYGPLSILSSYRLVQISLNMSCV